MPNLNPKDFTFVNPLIDNSHCGFVVLDNQLHCQYINPVVATALGLPGDEYKGQHISKLLSTDSYSHLYPLINQALSGKQLQNEVELKLGKLSLNDKTFHCSVYPISEQDNEFEGVVLNISDVTILSDTSKALLGSEQRYEQLVQMLPEGLCLVENRKIVYTNPALIKLTGYSKAQMLGNSPCHYLKQLKANTQLDEEQLQHLLEGDNEQEFILAGCAGLHYVRVSQREIEVLGKKVSLMLFHDITSAVKQQQRLNQMANFDMLTSLYNRYAFTKHVNEGISSDKLAPFSLLLIDLDNFKGVNDCFGHSAGDNLLQEVANRLITISPQDCCIARFGGDEFAIHLPGSSPLSVNTLAKRILTKLNQPMDLGAGEKQLFCSIGTTRYPCDGSTAETLIQNADIAMYQAKSRGKNQFAGYDEKYHIIAREKLNLELELLSAIKERNFTVLYQPKVATLSGEIIGVESLLRWLHPQMGLISPARFVPIAEQSGLIDKISQILLEQVFLDCNYWINAKLPVGLVSINLSPCQLGHSKILDLILKHTHHSRVPPQMVCFEITENAVMENSELAMSIMTSLTEEGFSLSLDDFGTGYSSLANLAKFPVEELKIDRRFVAQVCDQVEHLRIIETIISLGKILNMRVIAEGVETEQQAELLIDYGVDGLQGYHFYKPMPKHQLNELLKQQTYKLRSKG